MLRKFYVKFFCLLFHSSDFPVPKDYPIYLPHALAKKYLDLYADNFNLRPYISFNSKVIEVTHDKLPGKDQWKILYTRRPAQDKPTDTSEKHSQVFDAVLVCSGHHWQPHIPKLPGADGFAGKIIHSSCFKEATSFYGKNVLVVGKYQLITLSEKKFQIVIHMSTRLEIIPEILENDLY